MWSRAAVAIPQLIADRFASDQLCALAEPLQCNVWWWWPSSGQLWLYEQDDSRYFVATMDRHRQLAHPELEVPDRALEQQQMTHDAVGHRSNFSPNDFAMASPRNSARIANVQWSQMFAYRKSIRNTSWFLWLWIHHRGQFLVAYNRHVFRALRNRVCLVFHPTPIFRPNSASSGRQYRITKWSCRIQKRPIVHIYVKWRNDTSRNPIPNIIHRFRRSYLSIFSITIKKKHKAKTKSKHI